MSIAGDLLSPDDHNCGNTNHDVVHQMICKLQQRGSLVVAAAGNVGCDIATEFPAGYSEVLAVTMMVDYDGRAGGLQFIPPPFCFWNEFDDSYSQVSCNDGSIDHSQRFHILSAPGVCINSTFLTADPYAPVENPVPYTSITGTSLATPHVSATAALCFSGYLCPRIPILPQDMITKLVSDARQASIPITSIPGPYDLANPFTGDISPLAGFGAGSFLPLYGFLPTSLYPALSPEHSFFSPACP